MFRHTKSFAILPLLHHFGSWAKQQCHTFSTMGCCFCWWTN